MSSNLQPVVWVLDTSAIVHIKVTVPQAKQWQLFKQLELMVEQALVAFPKHVRDETDGLLHPDAPGVWAVGVFGSMKFVTTPDFPYIQQVMGSPAAKVVDPDKTTEDADPYVLALALQLLAEGHTVCVVTNDQRDLPTRIGLSTACGHLGVAWCGLDEFLGEVRPAL